MLGRNHRSVLKNKCEAPHVLMLTQQQLLGLVKSQSEAEEDGLSSEYVIELIQMCGNVHQLWSS